MSVLNNNNDVEQNTLSDLKSIHSITYQKDLLKMEKLATWCISYWITIEITLYIILYKL